MMLKFTIFYMLNNKKLLLVSVIGFISGFTLMISSNTLNYWLADEGINLKVIGVFALISAPYAVNFLWTPFFDNNHFGMLSKFVGERLSWIIIIQISMALFVLLLSQLSPNTNLYSIAIVNLLISFLSSTQDALLGALKTEIIAKDSQGPASGMYIFGYRSGMLTSNSGAIYLSIFTSWQNIYQIFALIILLFPLILYLALKANKRTHLSQIETIKNYPKNYYAWFQDNILFSLKGIKSLVWIAAFLVLYRLPDNFINMMINSFLLHLGYGAMEIASIGKFFGVATAIIGGFLASFIMKKRSILSSLLIFGGFHAVAHSLFVVQEIYGKSTSLLFIVIGFESITGGMTMAAYIAFISSLCYGKYRATQYSFYTAMMGVSRSVLPSFSGYLVLSYGWQTFFICASLATIPSLLIIFKLKIYFKEEEYIS